MIPLDLIHIHDLHLWAHVGVLDHERRDGQWFQLDITLGLDLSASAKSDDLSATADYSLAVQALQMMVSELCCLTIERFSDCLLYTSPSPRDRQKSRMPSSA